MAARGAGVGRGISNATVVALLAMLVAAAVLAALTLSLFSTGAPPRVQSDVMSFDTHDRTASIRVSHYGRSREDWMDSMFGGEAMGPPSLEDLLAKKQ
jgi:hypothetical protein